MSEIRFQCFKCGRNLVFSHLPSRREECSNCRSDVHVCLNCQYYDRLVYNECRETQAEVVKEKERANFCDYFAPGSGQPPVDRAEELRRAAEALFGGPLTKVKKPDSST